MTKISKIFKKNKKLITALTCLILMTPIAVSAYGTSVYQTPYPGSEITKPYKGEVDSNVSVDDYMFEKNGVKSIGFDYLYGSNKDLVSYFGEVSKADHKDKKASKYYYYPGSNIGSTYRAFSETKKFNSDAEKVTDPRYKSLTVTRSSNPFSFYGTQVLIFLQRIASSILKFWISITNFNIGTVVSYFNGSTQFTQTLSSIFLIDTKTKIPSPLFTISLIAFMFGFVNLGFRMSKGIRGATFKEMAQEMGLLMLAMVVASLFALNNGPSSIANTSANLTNKLGSSISSYNNPASSVFVTDTGDNATDSLTSQSSQISQIWINQVIKAQFGTEYTNLWIESPNTGTSSFGTKSQVQKALSETFKGDSSGLNSFKLSTGNGHSINNLGYWFYAANSNTAISEGGKPFTTNGSKTYLNQDASPSRMLFVMDFLANIREIHAKNKDTEKVAKIDNIMNSLTKPNYGNLASSSILITALVIATTYSLISIGIFTFTGKVICILGVYALCIMPILLLIKRTRKTAKGFIVSYLIAFVRFLAGSALFNTVLAINVLLSSSGAGGIITAIVISVILSKFGNKLIAELNQRVNEFGREAGELQSINSFNRNQLQTFYEDTLPGGRKSKEKRDFINQRKFNSDGTQKGRKSFGEHLQHGLEANGEGFVGGIKNSILGKGLEKDVQDNMLYHDNWDKLLNNNEKLNKQDNQRKFIINRKNKGKFKVNYDKLKDKSESVNLSRNLSGLTKTATKAGAFVAVKSASSKYDLYKAETKLSKNTLQNLNRLRGSQSLSMTSESLKQKESTGILLSKRGNSYDYKLGLRSFTNKNLSDLNDNAEVGLDKHQLNTLSDLDKSKQFNKTLTTSGAVIGAGVAAKAISSNKDLNKLQIKPKDLSNTLSQSKSSKGIESKQDQNIDGKPKLKLTKSNNIPKFNNIDLDETTGLTARQTKAFITNPTDINKTPNSINPTDTKKTLNPKENISNVHSEAIKAKAVSHNKNDLNKITREFKQTDEKVSNKSKLQSNSPSIEFKESRQEGIPNNSDSKLRIKRYQENTKPPVKDNLVHETPKATPTLTKETPKVKIVDKVLKENQKEAISAKFDTTKTNVGMSVLSKVPVIGKTLASNVEQGHANKIKMAKQLSKTTAEVAGESYVKSNGQIRMTEKEARGVALDKLKKDYKLESYSTDSKKEIKRKEKYNKRIEKTLDKSVKHTNSRNIKSFMENFKGE